MSTITGSNIPAHSCSDFVVTREPGVTEFSELPTFSTSSPLVSLGQGDYRDDIDDQKAARIVRRVANFLMLFVWGLLIGASLGILLSRYAG